MIRGIALALALVLCTVVQAAEKHGLILNLGSKHITNVDMDFQEQNLGLSYSYYFDDNRTAFQIGFYENSIYQTSVYAGGKYYFTETSKLRPAIMFGMVTGYQTSPMPFVAAAIDYEFIPTHKANLVILPNVVDNSIRGIVLGLQYEKLF